MAKTPYWWDVIEQAKAREKAGKPAFTVEQSGRAGNWTTCACGNQDSRIPRNRPCGDPIDWRLEHLGRQFSWAVNGDAPTEAASILRKIERRAAEVLAEVEATR